MTRRLWVRSPLGEINYYLLIFSFLRSDKNAALSSATQHAIKTRFTLSTLLYPGYSIVEEKNWGSHSLKTQACDYKRACGLRPRRWLLTWLLLLQLTRNISKILRKWVTGSLTYLYLPYLCGIQRETKKNIYQMDGPMVTIFSFVFLYKHWLNRL